MSRARFLLASVLAAAVLLCSLISPAIGASGQTGGQGNASSLSYLTDAQTAAYRSTLTSADSATIDAALIASAGTVRLGIYPPDGVTLNRATINVSARFSVSGASVSVRCVLLYRNAAGTYLITGVSNPITLTAGAAIDGISSGSRYIAPTYSFDGAGANYCLIQLAGAVSGGGNVTLFVGTV